MLTLQKGVDKNSANPGETLTYTLTFQNTSQTTAQRVVITDPLPNGGHALAVPRIIGAYAGSFAQASWRPATTTSRAQVALINGTTSLAIGFGINVFHELTTRHR